MLKIHAVKDFKGRPIYGFGRCEGRVEQLRKKILHNKSVRKKIVDNAEAREKIHASLTSS